MALDSGWRRDDETSGSVRAARGFIGGSFAAVALRLLVVSFVVGLFLTMFGLDPEDLYFRFAALLRHVFDFSLNDLRHFGRILLTGAMVVAPIWIVLRLMDMRRAR